MLLPWTLSSATHALLLRLGSHVLARLIAIVVDTQRFSGLCWTLLSVGTETARRPVLLRVAC
jgi:hypothetical protein